MDENSLFLALWDTQSSGWVEATSSCTPAGNSLHDPGANRLTVTSCATGEYALLGQAEVPLFHAYLPVISRR